MDETDDSDKDQKNIYSFDPSAAKASMNQPPSYICSTIYLGTQYNASNKYIKEFNLKWILNLKETHFSKAPKNVNFLHVPMSDYGDSNIKEIAQQCFGFIESALNNGENILVHCRGGLNRSVTILIAFLMVSQDMTLRDAYHLVKRQRDKVSPHKRYIEQLKEYELETRGVVTFMEEDYAPTLQDRIEMYRKDHISRNKINSHPNMLETSGFDFGTPPKLKNQKKSKTTPIDSPMVTKKKKGKKRNPLYK